MNTSAPGTKLIILTGLLTVSFVHRKNCGDFAVGKVGNIGPTERETLKNI